MPITINAGVMEGAQRSKIVLLKYSPKTPKALSPCDFLLKLKDKVTITSKTGTVVGEVGKIPDLSVSCDDGTYFITFDGPALDNGSLVDGVYQLVVNGQPDEAPFHRLFGDCDGDGKVNTDDYSKFMATFGKNASSPEFLMHLDHDDDGYINNRDYNQFKARFGMQFTY